MDGVGDQGLAFAVGIADADINGLGVGVAVLRGYGFVGGSPLYVFQAALSDWIRQPESWI